MAHKTENVELTVLCLIQDGSRVLLQNRVKDDWKVFNDPELTEFQYIVEDDNWLINLK